MARLARWSFPGVPHLLVLRSVPGQSLFQDDDDRRRFLSVLLQTSRACEVSVHAFALLDHEILMLVTPGAEIQIAQFMQRLGRRYVAAFNLRHQRTGPLWVRRYGAAAVDPESLILDCTRLIEQAPVREGRVNRPQDWPWSSAAHHTGVNRQLVLREHEQHWRLGNTPFEREAQHARLLSEPLGDAAVQALLSGALRGWPIGPDRFIDDLQAGRTQPLRPKPRGRPRTMEAPNEHP